MIPQSMATEDAAARLEREADALRAAGRLEAAAVAYDELLSMAADHLKSDRLLSSLTGRPSVLVSKPGGLKPAPFLLVPDFLPLHMRDALHASIVANLAGFQPAETVSGLHTEYRRTRLMPRGFDHVDVRVKRTFYERLQSCWAAARPRLRVPEFEPILSEATALLYGDGDFFRAHRDTGPNNTRRVTFVYTMHRTPRRFEGGDLLLYDTFFWPDQKHLPSWIPRFADTYTRLVPEDNRLVFFPSEFYHEVTPVSGVGDDLGWARVAINGWLDTTREQGESEYLARTPY
jgi:hypothetical protein